MDAIYGEGHSITTLFNFVFKSKENLCKSYQPSFPIQVSNLILLFNQVV